MSGKLDVSTILRQTHAFTELSQDHLDAIANISLIREYNAGEIIFLQGSDNDELYVVACGEVDIKVGPDIDREPHKLDTLTTIRRGYTFGEIVLVDRGFRTASAISGQNETQLIIIPRAALMTLCETNPDMGYKLMKNLASSLADTLRARTLDFTLRRQP